MNSARAFLAATVACVCLAAVSLGQTTGSIDGRVTDTNGAAIRGVTIQVESASLLGTRSAISGPDGFYRVPLAPPGDYRVTASLAGSRTTQKSTTVRLGATATVDFDLEPAAAEQVLVSGQAPVMDTTSTTTGTTYTSQVIAHLPVARNYADIVRANPGVSLDIGATDGRFLPVAIYGATSAENQWIIDGINTTNVYQGIQGKAIHNEFIQEVEVKTGGYQPEYGRALGGVINAVTKSGGNDFHGDGFIYYDSTGTAANPQSKPGDFGYPQPPQDISSNQFDYGVDLGGYLVKDRLWFFGAYNRVDQHSDLFEVYPRDVANNFYSGKLTWNASPATTAVATVFADPSTFSGVTGNVPFYSFPLNPETWNSESQYGGTDYGARLSQLFGSQAIAGLQGSYHRDRSSQTAADGIKYFDLTCSGGTPEHRCDVPQWFNNIWGGFGNLSSVDSSRVQFAADGTLYAGRHEIKAGGDYLDGHTERTSYTTGGQQVTRRNDWGQLYYEHRFNNYTGDTTTVEATRFAKASVIDYSAYLYDSWKPLANLTVNVGLRWDGEHTRNYADDTVLRFSEWQPRIGVAWDPWNDGTTKVFAFAGRFSYGIPTITALETFGRQPFFVRTYNFDPVSVVADANVINRETLVYGGAPFGLPVDAGLRAWSQNEVTVGIERLILPTLTVSLKGTYRALTNALETRCDFEYTTPGLTPSQCAFINPGSDGTYASGQTTTCDGLWDSPEGNQCFPEGPATPDAKRYYRGIELMARQSITNRLWLQASYIYASLRGNFDGAVNEGVFQQFRGQTLPSVDWDFNYPEMWHSGYGKLTLDRPFHFRLDGYWNTPWNLSFGLQAFAESGAPTNKMGYFNPLYGTAIFLGGRGTQDRLPTLWGMNLTLGYPFVVGPATVTAQAYLFNVFNKQIATATDQSWTTQAPPDYPASLYDPNQPSDNPNYGAVTARSDPRLFRAALKVSF